MNKKQTPLALDTHKKEHIYNTTSDTVTFNPFKKSEDNE